MDKLLITEVGGKISERALDQARLNIGRHANNDIVLADKAVSGKHAAVICTGSATFLEDLGSTNGSQINGRSVKKAALNHDDVIQLGRNTLRFIAGPLVADDDQTMVMRAPSPVAPNPIVSPPPAPTPVASSPVTAPPRGSPPANEEKRLHGKLRVISGAHQGRELLLSKPLTTIGKPGVQVVSLIRRGEGYFICQDATETSARPVLLNGAAIGAQTRPLNSGDQIELMGTQMKFVVAD